MPPDIRTGLPALAGGTSSVGTMGQGPPSSGPLAALFATLLAQSGRTSPQTVPTLPKLRSSAKTNSLPENESGPTKQAKVKTSTETTATNIQTSAPRPIFPPPLLPIQMRPITPPIADVTVGQKTMDTLPAIAALPKETTSVKPDGELPLQGAGNDTSGASDKFPAFLITSPSPKGQPSGLPTPAPPMMALPQVFDPAGTISSLSDKLVVPVISSVAMATVSVRPVSDAGDRATKRSVPSPSAVFSAPRVISAVSFAIDAGAKPESVEARQMLTVGPTRTTVSSVRNKLGKAGLQQTFVQDVGAAKDGNVATEGEPATEGMTAMDGTREGKAATEGRLTMDGKGARDGITTEGVQATEGFLSTAGRTGSARSETGPPSAKAAVPTLTMEMPEKSLKSAVASTDNNTRIDHSRVQTASAKMLPAELTLPVVGKRSERSATSETDSRVISMPATTAPATAETAKAQAKPLTAEDRVAMVRQLADGVGAMRLPTKPNVSEQMTLNLHPKDWGQLQVSVKITPSIQANAAQTVTAYIVAGTPQVKAALESGSGDLRQALRAAGLHLDRMTVTVQAAGTIAQTGTALSGGHHGMSGGTFGQTASDQKMDISGNASPGTPSFSGFTGSHGGRHGSQTPPAYTSVQQAAEPDEAEGPAAGVPRRMALGQVDTHA